MKLKNFYQQIKRVFVHIFSKSFTRPIKQTSDFITVLKFKLWKWLSYGSTAFGGASEGVNRGQKGMGELHLEIIQERIQKEYKVEAELGPLQVAYKETVKTTVKKTTVLEKIVGDSNNRIVITLSVHPHKVSSSASKIKLMHSKDNQENISQIKRAYMQAVENGVAMGLQHGPLLGFPVVQVQVGLHWLEVQPGSSLVMVAAAAKQCVAAALNAATACLLEPYMRLEVTTEPQHLHNVLGDLAQRRGLVLEIDSFHEQKVIKALVPLANMMRYSTSLRTITSGLATFNMELESYQNMTANEQQKAITRVTGFSV